MKDFNDALFRGRLRYRELVPLIAEGRLTRRDVSKALLAFGIVPALLPILPRPAHAWEGVKVFTWAGYEVPEMYPTYVEKHGTRPEFTTFGEEEEALQKLRAGFQADTADICTYSTARWRDARVIAPIDTGRLRHWPDLFDRLKTTRGCVLDGKQYMAPVYWGHSSVLYRTDLVDPDYIENPTWKILWDKRYRNRLGMFDSVDGAVGVAAIVAGVPDPYNMSDTELEKVRDLLKKQQSLLRYYWTSPTMLEQGLASGEIVASYAWSHSYITLKEAGVPVGWMQPKEGTVAWVCGDVRLAASEGDEEHIYDYIDATLSPEAGKFWIEQYGYNHANRNSFDLVPEALLKERGLAEDQESLETANILEPIAPDRREKYISMFEGVKIGL